MKITEVKANNKIEDVISNHGIKLERAGTRLRGKCPFHADKTPSMYVNVKKQYFKCYGCGEYGDVIDFVGKLKNMEPKEAANYIDGRVFDPTDVPKVAVQQEDSEYVPGFPIPAYISHYEFGKPTKTYHYTDKQGYLRQIVCRFEFSDGRKKEFRPYSRWTKNGINVMMWRAEPPVRSIYNLSEYEVKKNLPVIVVEGEKTADAAKKLFPKAWVTTWHNGASSVGIYDWSPLNGRKVILMPDNDFTKKFPDGHDKAGQQKPWNLQPGNAAMIKLYGMIKSKASVSWNPPPPGMKCGWDWADSKWDGKRASGYVRKNIFNAKDYISKMTKKANERPETAPKEIGPPPEPKSPENTLPFRPIGYDIQDFQQRYWFFSKQTGAILCSSSRQLGADYFIKELAPAQYWEINFPSKGKSRINLSDVAEMLRKACISKGVFSPKMIRGRGAWMDDGHVVFHAGDRIIENGDHYPLMDYQTKFAYQRKPPIEIETESYLGNREAIKLSKICDRFNWGSKVSGRLLAGWIVLAPFCGALSWRPHIWIIGGAGSGKSWILQNVIRPCLGDIQLAIQSSTTEAAVRQTLEGDALPVVFDEFEPEDKRGMQRVKAVIELARSSSTADGGVIVKGGKTGTSSSYEVRSMFCFASITQHLIQYSDISRITTLILGMSDAKSKQENANLVASTITPEYRKMLQCRTLRLLPVIIENAKIFRKAASQVLKETRLGDQIGMLLAGAYSLHSERLINYEDALEYISKQNWSDERAKDESKDEYRLLNLMIQSITKVQAKLVNVERSIGELIFIVNGEKDSSVTIDVATDRLGQIGIRVYKDRFVVHSESIYIKNRVLRDTPWVTSYAKILSRVEGAVDIKREKFAPGVIGRAVSLPMELINPQNNSKNEPGD